MITSAAIEFDAFYAEQQRALVRLAQLLCGSPGVAEELVQEAMLATHRRWDELDNPHGFARRVLVNLVRSHQRRRILERRHERRGRPAYALPPDIDEMWAAILRLPGAQRTVLVLRFYEDLTVPAIADVMDKPVGTVKSLLHRSLHQLKEVLS